MLKSLHIENYALIQHLDINFESGFSTLTGETGAGKSILLGALSLVTGSRADSAALRNNESKCVVEACFDISAYRLKGLFKSLDFEYDDETIIRREISTSGKSRAFVNDSPVNLADLKQLSVQLIDIHSQHENLALNNNIFQLQVIDAAANNEKILNEYKEIFRQYKEVQQQLNDLHNTANQAASDKEYNAFQFKQLCEIEIEELKLEELEQELEQINHAEEIKSNLHQVSQLISEQDFNALDQIKQAKQALDKLHAFYPASKELSERIESLHIELKDIANEVEQGSEDVLYDPERAITLKEQLDKIYSLFNKHNVSTLAELIEVKEKYSNLVSKQESYGYELEQLEKALNEISNKLNVLAEQLNANRAKTIEPFSNKIEKLLHDLGMPNAKLSINMSSNGQFLPTGKDQVVFMFSANKNFQGEDIAKIASGGEISRLMLSIKSIMSKSMALPTIIFDEIDTGVSGEIADKMANIMQNMANNMQVFSITHLPQIAAKGKNHYRVYKTEKEDKVSTQIVQLNEKDRVEEIAKMLSGKDITPQAIENAKMLINN